jgi:hypothetical protein
MGHMRLIARMCATCSCGQSRWPQYRDSDDSIEDSDDSRGDDSEDSGSNSEDSSCDSDDSGGDSDDFDCDPEGYSSFSFSDRASILGFPDFYSVCASDTHFGIQHD